MRMRNVLGRLSLLIMGTFFTGPMAQAQAPGGPGPKAYVFGPRHLMVHYPGKHGSRDAYAVMVRFFDHHLGR